MCLHQMIRGERMIKNLPGCGKTNLNGSNAAPDPAGFTKASPEQTLRDLAAERLRALGDVDFATLPPEEIRRRLHELNVHQVELEIQNEHLRQTQAKLDAARARYFDLYDLAPLGYLTFDENGVIQEANLTAATLLGVIREGLLNKPISNWILVEDQKIYYLHCKHLFESGIPQAFELRMVKKDKKIFWARLNATTSHNSAADVPMFRIVLGDITEHKQAAEALRQSENRFQKLFRHHSAVMLVIDTETGCIIDANEAAEQFYGWTFQELRQMRIQEFNTLPPAVVKAEMLKVSSVKSARFEFRHRRANGSVRDVEVFSDIITSAGKQFYFSIIHDITERKQVEQALRQEERLLRTTIETTADGFWVVNTRGKIIQVNSAYCRMSGYTVDELLTLDISTLDAVERPAMTKARIQRIITNGSELFSTLHKRKDGSIFPVEVSVTYINSDPGEFVCFCRDITERKLAVDRLQTLNDELELRVEKRTRELQETHIQYLHAEKLAAIGKLSASIAHEFNNPLQGIMAVLKGLRKRAILEEEDRELLNAAIDESDRMKKLIRSLQDFNRPSSCTKTIMDVQKSIDSLLLLHKNDFKSKRISVQLHYAKRLPQIMAIPDQIKQVFLNLLANAADACRLPGGVITVSTWQEDNKVAISIKDTGIGIQPEQMSFLFQPFYTTKPDVKGTGLGLSICHGIVKNHQGEIRVESQPGKGATFTVLLPAQGI